ncbi:MAG: damage-inducible protein D [Acidobacteria bacterium]|nr:damage-inducible protein D [Acidobacteriota bacterium]
MAAERQLNLFHAEEDRPSFEALGRSNGGKFWYARDFMKMLGYESFEAFRKPINKAIATCTALEIQVAENFTQVQREVDGAWVADFKLTRFACYLISINGDVRKPEVAAAQAYFVTMAEAFRQYIQDTDGVERVQIRDEVSEREKSLTTIAHRAGVQSFQFFHNAGYRGMYNMDLAQLKQLKGVSHGRTVLDFMGRQELAANLFRITQTEAKIENEDLRGQRQLEKAAFDVGQTVRNTMIELSGKTPESLPTSEDIAEVRGKLKQARREFGRIDKPSRKKLPPPQSE